MEGREGGLRHLDLQSRQRSGEFREIGSLTESSSSLLFSQKFKCLGKGRGLFAQLDILLTLFGVGVGRRLGVEGLRSSLHLFCPCSKNTSTHRAYRLTSLGQGRANYCTRANSGPRIKF
ncbi:hypothetical protein CDAR_117881 [Caerostris darwini]|uniref:Uncharacterized protein n=1 Tax=Caerostris darwini TaxID=1538125 RepID=A0AAV4PZD8_9ARAC|nr:hypothetical protein CDAR_117881 [Caerostris darwini]